MRFESTEDLRNAGSVACVPWCSRRGVRIGSVIDSRGLGGSSTEASIVPETLYHRCFPPNKGLFVDDDCVRQIVLFANRGRPSFTATGRAPPGICRISGGAQTLSDACEDAARIQNRVLPEPDYGECFDPTYEGTLTAAFRLADVLTVCR